MSGEAGSFAVVVCAGSLREAEQIVKERFPESAVGVAFPIEPDHFFGRNSRACSSRNCSDWRRSWSVEYAWRSSGGLSNLSKRVTSDQRSSNRQNGQRTISNN